MEVDIGCKYLIFTTSGYDSRLNDIEFSDTFETFCNEWEVVPLAIYAQDKFNIFPFVTVDQPEYIKFVYSGGKLTSFLVNDSYSRERDIPDYIKRFIKMSNMYSCIIFEVKDFKEALNIASAMKEVEYCRMFDISNIKFYLNEDNVLELCRIDMDAESG